MAKKVRFTGSTIALVFLCFLLLSFEAVEMVGADVCGRRSWTWQGLCGDSGACANQCQRLEGAVGGGCRATGIESIQCICYYPC